MEPVKILHIEDSRDNRLLVRALLPRDRYVIVEAEDGLSGIAVALRERPALILLDINLPDVDGYEVGIALRSFPALRETPIVAVTAYAMQGDRERTLAAGCDGYIPKPLDADAFPRLVEEFLRGRRERLEDDRAAPFLRELIQRVVDRLLAQVEDLHRLERQAARRAQQLEALHAAVQGVRASAGVRATLEALLPRVVAALGASQMTVELVDPPGLRASASAGAPEPRGEEWQEVEWAFPLVAEEQDMGLVTVRACVSPATKTDDAQLARLAASQVAIALANARLYEGLRGKVEELEQAQGQLVQAAKLAAVGELAAQVAHEINNPLTSVLGFASLLLEELPPDSPLREDARLILSEAGRARDIVRDLLDFSRQRPFFPQTCDLNTVLRQVVALVRLQGVLGITIDEQYAPDLPLVEVDPARIKQVFLNLISNALQAMPRGGVLVLRTQAGPHEVRASVTDTGTGIPREHLGRIFEPFFTTRSEAGGTGLGLAVSLGIVRQHGGDIEVQSEVGRGSTFTVRLPLPRGEDRGGSPRPNP